MDLAIRRAMPQDYDALSALFAEVDELHREALPQLFRKPDGPPRTREFIEGILACGDAALLVAEAGGVFVGAVCVVIRQASDVPILVPRRFAAVDDLMVARRARRQGVGRALMMAAERWARDKGVTQIELNVWEFNRGAVAFYEALGYATASRRMWKSL